MKGKDPKEYYLTRRNELINMSKRGTPEDIKYLLKLYLDNNKNLSSLAKEPLNKTHTDITPYLQEMISQYRERDLRKWHKLIVLGLHRKPELFLEDLIEEGRLSEDESSLTRNIRNLNWNQKKLVDEAIRLIPLLEKYPKAILACLKDSRFKSDVDRAVYGHILNGGCSPRFLSYFADSPEMIADPNIQKKVYERVTNHNQTDYIEYYKYLDYNSDVGLFEIYRIRDLAKIYKILSTNIIGLREETIEKVTLEIRIVYKLMNTIDLQEDEEEFLWTYVDGINELDYMDDGGNPIGCPRYIISFLHLLGPEAALDAMEGIYDNPQHRSKQLEDAMLNLHSDRVYRDWINEILVTNDLSKRHVTAKKLLMNFPEKAEEIFYVVDSVGIEKYYANVKQMAADLGIDITHITKFDIQSVLHSSTNVGMAIYNRCLELNDSVEEVQQGLEHNGIYVESFKNKDLDEKKLAALGQLLRCMPGKFFQGNLETGRRLFNWLKLLPKIYWLINGQVDENANMVCLEAQAPRNADESVVLRTKIDLEDRELKTREISVYLLYNDREYCGEMVLPQDQELAQMVDEFYSQNPTYKYLCEDIRRISLRGAEKYVLELTKSKIIQWEKKGTYFHAISGEEEFLYNPFYKDQNGLLQINIENRMEYKFVDKGANTELKRVIAGIIPPKPIQEPKKEEPQIIGVADFLVRTTNYACTNKDHNLKRIKALVNVFSGQKMFETTIDAAFCPECNKYYILERDYQLLRLRGRICCKVVEIDELLRSGLTFNSWQEKSLLRIYGYNVNKNENLTQEERQRILSFVLENGIMTSYEIINHLEWQISTREGRLNMSDAISKWEDDIRYVRNYQYVNATVRVRSIFIKNKRKRYF